MALNWGVLGAGGIADRRMIPEGIVASPMCHLAMVMDAAPDRARAVGEKYGVPHSSDLDAVLANPDVDIVYIATPTFLHKAQAIAAARAGKHVLLEKPDRARPHRRAGGSPRLPRCRGAAGDGLHDALPRRPPGDQVHDRRGRAWTGGLGPSSAHLLVSAHLRCLAAGVGSGRRRRPHGHGHALPRPARMADRAG